MILLILFFCFQSLAQSGTNKDVKAILHIGGVEEFTQAKPVPFEFQLYPVGEKTIDELKNVLKVGRFLEKFYVFDIIEKGFSPNNQDVYVVKGRMVMVDVFRKGQLFTMDFNGSNVYVEVRSEAPKELKAEGQEVIFAPLPFIYQMSFWEKILYGFIAFLVLSGLFAGARKLFVNMKEKKERKKKRLMLIESFSNAQSRDDFERLYKTREEWISYLGGKNPEAVTFLKDLEDVQYKRDWTDEETNKIKQKTQELQKTIETI